MNPHELEKPTLQVPESLVEVVNKLDTNNNYMIYHWNSLNILKAVNLNSIFKLKRNFKAKQEMNLAEFCKALLSVVKHNPRDSVYLVAGAISLFEEITVSDTINWKSLSDWILNRAMNSQNIIDKAPTKLSDHTSEPTLIFGAKEEYFFRLKTSYKFYDKQRHPKAIKKAVYSPSTKKIFSVDDSTEKLFMYNNKAKFEKFIKPKSLRSYDVVVVDFAWSETQKRLGVLSQDRTLKFMDYEDEFSFQKSIHYRDLTNHLQTKIWHLEPSIWLTTDQTHLVHEWSIENENFSTWPQLHQASIVAVVQIQSELVATSALDRSIVVFNFLSKAVITKVHLQEISAYKIAYSEDLKLLVSASFSSIVSVWTLDNLSDVGLYKELQGHTKIVSALHVVKGTPILVSSDTSGLVKTWDLRHPQCLQSIKLRKSNISHFLNIPSVSCLCGVGSRLYWLEYTYEVKYNANGINVRPI